ncbi:hypothetical protein GS429_05590 [Natronorubrum sp. JWXQ-INN-674]|uniref:Sjogren's syndrome/scleroderma autoantigen 1 (Autoantigen p27) n=1 Tax=Natronorubrum halalkaliphilum TaxID=2691917 RepID=A0A6B0VJ36_9EURY|nr:Sjogren's syndrome/scleroderma autoantigen 1 family protein [Natronorubrum halalkaliphilum]MXV61544.1 hypothetical protein [Natronorubrum halalkaliphilum]
MSDFDKEAEREKLREKYERDKEERQATQRMSDLLLKGATMTNSHCGTCGDPLFQQDGTTFCPSCHGNPDAVQGTNLEAQPAEESAGQADTDPASEPVPSRASSSTTTDDARAADVRGADAGPNADPVSEPEPESESKSKPERQQRQPSDPSGANGSQAQSSSRDPSTPDASRDDRTTSEPRTRTDSTGRDSAGSDDRRSSDRHTPSSAQPATGDLEAAHDSLVRALEKFAGKAAATDDPRHAKACLEAAREASETLESLR